jgi:hypothetical protein
MRSVSKAWPARLLAAVMAFALVEACIVGAYAHAVGHALPPDAQAAPYAVAADHQGHHASVSEAARKGGDMGATHDCGQPGHSHTDCCDTICHGAHAILAPDTVVPHPPHVVPLIQPAAAFHGAEPGGLDRPPKPFRSA